jgi:hypothetical protein
MKYINTRTLLLLAITWIGVVLAIVIKETAFVGLQRDVVILQMESDKLIWDVVHELSDQTFAAHVSDYSYWDDMVAFARGELDDAWAEENINPVMESLGLAAVWILDADGTLRHGVRLENGAFVAAPQLPFTKTQIATLLERQDDDEVEEYGPVREFYWLSDIGPLTLFASDITTTDDPDHLKDAQGYYIVASELSEEGFLKEVRHLGMVTTVVSGAEVRPVVPPSASGPHIFWHPLEDISGTVVGAIKIENTTESFVKNTASSRFSRNLTSGLWVSTGIAVSLLVLSLGRTRQRASDLAQQMTHQLQEANETLERTVAERTKELASDIAQRKVFEAQLEKRTRDLETMNRAMLDRESRVVELKHELEALKKSQQPS